MRMALDRSGRFVLATAVLLGTAGLWASVAQAQNPHFIKATASLDKDGNLIVSWKEAGVGDNANITYTASAVANATYQCVNHGNNCPQAANKQTVAGPVSATGTFASGKNGQITASLTVEPPPATITCPGNQILKLADVSYSNILLSDDTNGISATVVPAALSTTFFVCP
jgi:hypothetical protein